MFLGFLIGWLGAAFFMFIHAFACASESKLIDAGILAGIGTTVGTIYALLQLSGAI